MQSSSARVEANDRIHYRLKNWGAFQRANVDDGPPEHPVPAEWQSQVTDRGKWPAEPLEDHYIDECDAERVQRGIILCMEHHKAVAMVLVRHYHYQVAGSMHNLRKARNKFWRYLF